MLTDFIKFVVFSVNYNRDICVFPHFSLLYIIAGGFICEKDYFEGAVKEIIEKFVL